MPLSKRVKGISEYAKQFILDEAEESDVEDNDDLGDLETDDDMFGEPAAHIDGLF